MTAFFPIHIQTSILPVCSNYKVFDVPVDHDQVQKWPWKGFEFDTSTIDSLSISSTIQSSRHLIYSQKKKKIKGL